MYTKAGVPKRFSRKIKIDLVEALAGKHSLSTNFKESGCFAWSRDSATGTTQSEMKTADPVQCALSPLFGHLCKLQ